MPASGPVNKEFSFSVGSYLRESRKSLGITLEDAARITRIGKNYLTALEEDRFDTLPNRAYVKGFLRAYAGFLGLSGDEIIAMYDRASSPQVLETFEHKAIEKTGSYGRGRQQGRWIVFSFLVVLVITAAYLFREKETAPENIPASPVALPKPPGPFPVQQARSSAALSAATAAAPTDKTASDLPLVGAEARQGGIVLRLKVNQDSSLNVTIDGMISQQYDLKAGDLIEWKADKVIALEMSNAGGVEAELNGKPLKPFGAPGKSANVVLKADPSLP